jgi:drug/metabolite transporter (DMT)-like permease
MNTTMKIKTVGALAVATLFWSSAFSAIRYALQYHSAGHIVLIRFLAASILLICIGFWKKIGLPKWKDIPMIAFLGITAFPIYQLALVEGEKTVLAGNASLIIAASPIIVSIFSVVFYKEKLNWIGWIGSLVGFTGVALISFTDLVSFNLQPGSLLIFVAAICISIYNVFQKQLHQAYSVLQLTVYTVVAGTLFLLFKLPGLTSALVEAPIQATLSIVYLGVFPTVISFLLWNYGLRQVSASLVSSFHYLTPVIAVFIAWVWLGELPTVLTVFGGFLTIVGVVIVTSWGKISKTAHH